MTLPPGQRAIDGFPRFGTHLHHPPPPIPANPVIEVGGELTQPFALAMTDLAQLPRVEVKADFHCVAGWSATDLRWEGIPFAAFYRTRVEPILAPGISISHVVFEGLDGFQSIALLEDALADDVLIADRLDGQPLTSDHGAPIRLVSPGQYGFVNTKHLCRIEFHTSQPIDPDKWVRSARGTPQGAGLEGGAASLPAGTRRSADLPRVDRTDRRMSARGSTERTE